MLASGETGERYGGKSKTTVKKAHMPEIKTSNSRRVHRRGPYKRKPDTFSLPKAERSILRDLILKKGMSLHEAAVAGNIDVSKAHSRLFDKHPTEAQINRAMEIYDKGLSFNIACVASGVSFEHFRTARKNRVANEYKPQRW
jgi:hypothetical protein